MGIHDTDAEEVSREMLQSARESLQSLCEWLAHMENAMERHRGGAYPIAWCSTMMEKSLNVYNDVARANGAVLVRAVEPVVSGAS